MAQCSVFGATLRGVEAVPVTVEIVVSGGIPGMSIVGMADVAVQEARERVKAAIRASGFTMPNEKIVVNLAPGNLRKTGSGFDLPIAMGILAATGQIDPSMLKERLYVGELSLEGHVRCVTGVLAFGVCAYKMGCTLVGAPDNAPVPLDGLEQLALSHLGRLHAVDAFEPLDLHSFKTARMQADEPLDFKDVAGHESAKRALQIAAAGCHGVLMMGPPGSGKTMLASRIPSILTPLEQNEMLESAVVHSVAGEDVSGILSGLRPFRHPHHSATSAGLVGGGNPIRPGEVSLAHCGVLFLDELAEFKVSALQALRQPMESGRVCLTRADGNVIFPARFMLVAASNPCPCGYYGDDERDCTCTLPQIRQYLGRIGGPLMDRIDVQLDVRRLDPTGVLETGNGADSHTLREGVMRAREFASWRARHDESSSQGAVLDTQADRTKDKFDRDKKLRGNIRNPVLGKAVQSATPRAIVEACGLDGGAREFIVSMAQTYSMSGRALINTLNVARTIADIEECETVATDHLAEALGFRLREGIGGH